MSNPSQEATAAHISPSIKTVGFWSAALLFQRAETTTAVPVSSVPETQE